MTPQERAFLAAIKQRLAERGALLLATEAGVIDQLKAARALILEQLAAQPGDFAQWRLPQLLEQIEAVLAGALGRAAGVADQGLRAAWQQGEDFVDKPLAAGGLNVEIQLPVLDATVLQQMRAFAAMRFKDVATEAATKIGRQLGLVTLGAQTPFEAIKQIQTLLGSESPRRATTIVRTEVSRAFALASDQRLTQAAKVVPGLGKQWRRSGKIHSRWTHDLMDGQVVDAGKLFKVPSMEGGFDMMAHPHDPTAPADQNINCGCVALPYKASWTDTSHTRPPLAPDVTHPGAKPFTAQELKLDPRKAQAGQAAQRAQARAPRKQVARPEVQPELPGAAQAVIPPAKLAGYALNPAHDQGGSDKARVFESALGYTAANADELGRQLLAGLKGRPATAALRDAYGQRWTVDIPVTGPKGAAIVKTGWIVQDGNDAPRLISARVIKAKAKKS